MRHQLSVVLDPSDNSITFDPPLVKDMDILSASQAFIHTFKVQYRGRACYAFAFNPPISTEENICSEVQIDDLTGDIGYECLCPSVSRICYDYALPDAVPIRITVSKHRTKGENSFTYYIISPPKFAPKVSSLPSKPPVEYVPTAEEKAHMEEMERLRQEAYERIKHANPTKLPEA